ncbi:flagellar motor switch protein FliN [Gluconacetobacter tumulicola]|uniref:Flagellar motor switch protein FliN n=1 Tax=Gluconacetobacter tumulicola TaxID=1017177 RepID=A0A7W4JB08_9PROT|nr:flagellar motor switch protein FliN [Gluconacetobacter tumulicola]MBB2177891.1 flagellar motor switch protein FliN [Gluconacetobacter tumulicola]
MNSDSGHIGLEDFSTNASAASPAASAPEQGDKDASTVGASQMEAVYDIPVRITAVIGTATMPVSQLLRLGRGAVVELNKKLGEAVDIYANNRLIARGEVVVVDDNHIGVTMTEILSSSPTAQG